jgi:hypothetical protein
MISETNGHAREVHSELVATPEAEAETSEPRSVRDYGHVMSGPCPCGHDHEMVEGRGR